MTDKDQTQSPSGLPAALGAYTIWGLLPLYLILVQSVPPFEFVGWRIIWTLPLCLLIVALRKQFSELFTAIRDRKVLLTLMASATLIGVNWLVYIWAIQNGNVYAASLGYYMNPLLNVVLGTAILGEKLSARQWIAVALAACGVAILAMGALTTLWISMTLAVTFGTYGLLRKQVAVGSLPGLTIESTLLLLPASGIALYYAGLPQGSAFTVDPLLSFYIVLGGVVTAVPLLLFAVAARRMDYSTLGFIQFLAPSIVFLLGLFVFKEDLKPAQLGCFLLIWSALAIFLWDLWSRRPKAAST
ncbi:EamA family transporter RarD [Pontixanthobacter aestiaquae]|uniref:EamA family transporter RarD n=1 Tax=Pontixanthobacter aestiaquae TaxID=1509367 RepID=A0A844ZBH0_9SPHN|nr:EamA family transporter RarD [Pontixanthobacter aestiaquae]MDN3645816.1 EamA family transporter RarD [Pontixanthobacter aestiaquae]MXO83189.1 EamA family transporter RarD [Pontixanthobacter aestiaquae]